MTELNNLEVEHHYLNGGSVIGRRKYCPGSLKMELKALEDVGPEVVADYTITGTKVHKAIEILLPYSIENWNAYEDTRYESVPKQVIQEIKTYLKDTWEAVDEFPEIYEAAQLACEDVLRVLGDRAPNIGYATEKKVVLDHELELGGTADFVFAYLQDGKKYGGIWDYKNGTTHVHAEETLQLLLYAVAFQEKALKKQPFEAIETHIFIPNTLERGQESSSRTFTKEQLAIAKEDFIEVAKTALGLNGEEKLKLKFGDHCKWCKAKAICAEYHSHIKTKALYAIEIYQEKTKKRGPLTPVSAEELLGQVQSQVKKSPQEVISTLDDSQLLLWFANSPYILELDKAVKEYLRGRHLQGNPVPGTKVVSTTSRRIWSKAQSVKDIGDNLKQLGVAKPWRKDLKPIGEIEKELVDRISEEQEITKKDAKPLAADYLKEYVEESRTSTYVVLDNEKNQHKEAVSEGKKLVLPAWNPKK